MLARRTRIGVCLSVGLALSHESFFKYNQVSFEVFHVLSDNVDIKIPD